MTEQEYLDFANKNYANQERYSNEIKQVYKRYIREVSLLTKGINFDANKKFKFSDYPRTKKLLDKLLLKFANEVKLTIENGIYKSWDLANKKNDALVLDVFDGLLQSDEIPTNYNLRNIESLKAFQSRKESGLNLSNRVWNITQQFNDDIELFLDQSILSGISAIDLAKELDNSFLKSKTIGGRGVYKDSFANSLRLTRTEINMSYRQADNVRFQQLDFVVGQEIRRSNKIYKCDVCEPLSKKYPKEFVFRGFHPNCRCFVVPILCSSEEFNKLTINILKGQNNLSFTSKNEIKIIPKEFNNWVDNNKDRILRAKNIPYFLSDNLNVSSLKFLRK